MKQHPFNKLKVGSFALIAIATLLSSCLKDKGPIEDYSKGEPLVSWQYGGVTAQPYNTSIYGKSDDSTVLNVTLSVASLTLKTPVTATVAADPASLTAYNTDNGTTYEQLSTDLYTLPNGGKVTINPGEQIVNFVVRFAGDKIDFAKDNALALKITDAQGATIPSNLNTAILLIKLRNPYEGTYVVTGYVVHPSAPRAISQTKTIVTISPTRSEAPLADLGGYFFRFDVDATNHLVNWEPVGSTPALPQSGFMTIDNPTGDANHPGLDQFNSTQYNNTYDPATHTFWMHYGYGVGSSGQNGFSREVYEKWVLQQ